jgi:hypothetical protein
VESGGGREKPPPHPHDGHLGADALPPRQQVTAGCGSQVCRGGAYTYRGTDSYRGAERIPSSHRSPLLIHRISRRYLTGNRCVGGRESLAGSSVGCQARHGALLVVTGAVWGGGVGWGGVGWGGVGAWKAKACGRRDKFEPKKYFSIDRVFRNETLDATHLAEFHQARAAGGDVLYGLRGPALGSVPRQCAMCAFSFWFFTLSSASTAYAECMPSVESQRARG